MEIYLDEEKSKDGYPGLKYLIEIKNTIYQILANVIKWANINDDDGYIQDAYFDNENFIDIDFVEATNLYDKLKRYYISVMPEIKTSCYKSDGIFDYYDCIFEKGNPSYDDLVKSTGFSKEWIRKISRNLEELKIVQRIRSTMTFVTFHCNKTMEIAKAILRSIKFEKEFTDLSKEKRKKKRIESRKKRKIKLTILENKFVKKAGVRLLKKVGYLTKVNGGLYRLQNVDYIGEKPKNYEKLVREFG